MAASAALDATVMGLLKGQPMRSSDLAKAAGAKLSSTGARLHRLHQRGLIARDEGGVWSATA
jgi:DNA-binding IclR family transcriptional regulator